MKKSKVEAETKELIELKYKLERENITLVHANKMEEIRTETEGRKQIERLHHECEMERQRIKTAEIRKAQMREGKY